MGTDYHNPFDYMFYSYFNKECFNEIIFFLKKREDIKSTYGILPLAADFLIGWNEKGETLSNHLLVLDTGQSPTVCWAEGLH